jgi:hypothetical protein
MAELQLDEVLDDSLVMHQHQASDITGLTTYTDEMAQDAVGNAVGNGLDYNDTTGAVSVDETELDHNSLGSKQGGSAGEYYHLTSAQVTALHAKQHAITSTADHTSSATSGQMLKADANGLPINATNTDAQVAGAVTNSHVAVTVTDTASVDLGLTGQAITATVLPAGVDHNSLANLNTGNGTTHTPANGASTQLLQYASAGTSKWITVSGDASIADGGVLAVNKTRLNVRNETGTTIASTKAVYVSGFNNVPLISLANNTVETQHNVVGITIAPIADQANGFIATTGQCDAETNAWTVGTELFLSTSGALTATAPTSGTVRHVAIVTVQQNYPAGKLLIYNFPEENYFAGGAGTDNIIRMGGNSGTNKTSFRDYANNEVAFITSDGVISASNLSGTNTGDVDLADLNGLNADGSVVGATTQDQTFTYPLIFPTRDYALSHADGEQFNNNAAGTPTGWTEVTAGLTNNTTAKFGSWYISTNSVAGKTAFKYRKKISSLASFSAYWGVSFNGISWRDGAYTADHDYWFGVVADNAGTPDETQYNRVNLHWSTTYNFWEVRHELSNGTTTYNGDYWVLTNPLLMPLYFRIVNRVPDDTARRGYIGTNFDAQTHSLLQTKTLACTFGTNPWIQIESQRTTGVDGYMFMDSIDLTNNA